MRAIKVYCPPGVEPPLYAFIDALDGKLKATLVFCGKFRYFVMKWSIPLTSLRKRCWMQWHTPAEIAPAPLQDMFQIRPFILQ